MDDDLQVVDFISLLKFNMWNTRFRAIHDINWANSFRCDIFFCCWLNRKLDAIHLIIFTFTNASDRRQSTYGAVFFAFSFFFQILALSNSIEWTKHCDEQLRIFCSFGWIVFEKVNIYEKKKGPNDWKYDQLRSEKALYFSINTMDFSKLIMLQKFHK